MSGPEKIEALKRRQKYYKNKAEELRRLVDVNFDNQTCFLTLTQNKDSIIRDDVDCGNNEFKKFIKRLKYYLYKYYSKSLLKYLATWERTKKGILHYHIILFSFPYIQSKTIEKIWGHGFIKINLVDHVQKDKKAAYIAKYFSKDLELRDAQKRAYFSSKNLKKPYEDYYMCFHDRDFFKIDNPVYLKQYDRISKINGSIYKSKVNYSVYKKI